MVPQHPKRARILHAIVPWFIVLLILPLNKCDERINKATKASENIIVHLGEAQQIKEQMHDLGKINDEEDKKLTTLLAAATAATEELATRGHKLRLEKEPDTLENRKELVDLLAKSVAAITKFKASGVDTLQSPFAKLQFDGVFENIHSNLQALYDAFDCPPISHDCVKCPPTPPGKVICEA